MYIHKVSLRNIRGFETLDFDFARPDETYSGWTVFTGDNGSGKSTLLKAIAVCLTGKDTARALQPSFHRWIRQGARDGTASIQLEILRTEEDDELTMRGRKPGRQFPAKLTLKNGGKETTLQVAIPPGEHKAYKLADRTIWASAAKGWFSCGYGPFRRVFGASSEATQIMVSASTARFATMFQEAASLSEADRWLRDLNHKKLEGKESEQEQLELLLQILADDLMPNQLTVKRVDSDGLWLADRNDVELAWSEMSDGYRAALALLTDIVRHLINAYGVNGLTGKDSDGRLCIKRSGVVLIDEIDAHLHPEWQREIGFWLKNHFPNIQFLVTTHSPIICQAADPNGLFVLPEPGSGVEPHALSDEDYRKVISSRPDTILLTPAFGLQNTRSPEAVENRAKYARLQAKKRATGKLTKDEEKLAQQLELFAKTDEEL
ncbi:MAG: AAA family ATPase [Verrucomicrobiota bacterium]|nr:AAA family ATPase [Verrucomicrobiota bacterium]